MEMRNNPAGKQYFLRGFLFIQKEYRHSTSKTEYRLLLLRRSTDIPVCRDCAGSIKDHERDEKLEKTKIIRFTASWSRLRQQVSGEPGVLTPWLLHCCKLASNLHSNVTWITNGKSMRTARKMQKSHFGYGGQNRPAVLGASLTRPGLKISCHFCAVFHW